MTASKNWWHNEDFLIESLHHRRSNIPEGVQKALENTSSQRVKRMFLYMAEKAGHYWFDMLDTGSMGLTKSKLQLVENGNYISKYKITAPKELNDYE